MSWNDLTRTLNVMATTNSQAGTYYLRVKTGSPLANAQFDFSLTISIDPSLPDPTPIEEPAFTTLSSNPPFFVSPLHDQFVDEGQAHIYLLPRAYDPDPFDSLTISLA